MRSKPASPRTSRPISSIAHSAKRLRLLGSGSAMAGAIAVAGIMSSPLAAQTVPHNVPQIPSIEMPLPMETGGPVRGPIMRGPANDRGPNAGPFAGTIGGPRPPAFPTAIASDLYIQRNGLSLSPATVPPVLPVNSQPASPPINAPTAAQPVIVPPSARADMSVTGVAAQSSGPVRTGSTTIAPSPGDTNTTGINVRASANYFSSEINFQPGTAVDVVDVLTSEAIINWTTLTAGTAGSDVTFLGAGSSLEFSSTLSDYTVLNRIFTPGFDSAVRIDGSVTSTVLAGGSFTQPGGNIWFYSPGGMIVGSTGSFNVGSLVLSSSDLNAIDSGGQQLNFLGVAEPDTAIVIEAGATINAIQSGSYVAMVAPRVEQAGTVTVDGSVAYIGAEQAQLTINNGLFDISVGVGTADANGVVHTGTTTGAASQASVDGNGFITDSDARAIYMIAVPKNEAMTMLVGGNIGYQAAAGAARTDNGTIILSAGADVATTGPVEAPVVAVQSDTAVAGGSIELTGGTISSDLTIVASEDITIFPEFGETFTMGSDGRGAYALDLTAGDTVNFGAGIGGTLSIDGDVSLRAGIDRAVGGTINLQAIGNVPGPFETAFGNGRVDIGGDLTVDASGSGRDDFFTVRDNGGTGIGEDATGGDITFTITNNASVNIGGDLNLDASAQGGKGETQNGSSTGGNIAFTLDNGSIDVAGAMEFSTSAINAAAGKIGGNGLGGIGNDGIAGDIAVILTGGGLDVGTLVLIADATGTAGSDLATEQDNSAAAGNVTIDITGGFHFVDDVQISARATGAGSVDGAGNSTVGSAERGTAAISISNPSSLLVVARDVNIDLETSGPVAAPTGNVASIIVDGTLEGGLQVTDDIIINTSAGNGSATETTVAGSVLIQATDGVIAFNTLSVRANATPDGEFDFGGSGVGQNFQAGDLTIASIGGNIAGRSAFLSADATGADGTGGSGTGGNILLDANDGAISFTGFVSTSVDGTGGVGEDANNPGGVASGNGGQVRFLLRGTDGSMAFNSLSASADGRIAFDVEVGTASFAGSGGRGLAGDVIFDIESGVFTAGNVTISADGFGGQGGDLPTGSGSPIEDDDKAFSSPVDWFDENSFAGTAMAAAAQFNQAAGASGTGAAMGGAGGMGGRGGDGTGGTVEFNLTGGSMTVNNLEVTADGIAGEGAFGDLDSGTLTGDGGDAFGGTATFNAVSGSLIVANELSVTARGNTEFDRGDGGSGSGVAGGAGGNATGGNAVFNMDGTAIVSAGSIVISADAYGGEGGRGFGAFDFVTSTFQPGEAGGHAGSGTGGTAVFNNTSGTIGFGSLTVSADGTGGEGGSSFGISTGEAVNNGGIGGAGIGGIATVNLNQDDGSDPVYIVQARGLGGAGGVGFTSGDGGTAQGGTARINVNNVNVNLTSATIDASAFGGEGGFVDGDGGNGGAGGNATAGSSILDVNGAAAVLNSDTAMIMLANAVGGAGGNGADLNFGTGGATEAGDGGAGGNAAAGLVQVIARDGATARLVSDTSVAANAIGGAGGNGGVDFVNFVDLGSGGNAGSATGGTVQIIAEAGGALDLVSLGGATIISADATGGAGGFGGNLSLGLEGLNGAHGETLGGTVALIARGAESSLNLLDSFEASARATGSDNEFGQSVGADATGGTLSIDIANGGAISADAAVSLNADAIGASGLFNAGNAVAGTVNIAVDEGSLAVSNLSVSLRGTAADGQNDFNGTIGDSGTGVGGNLNFTLGTAGNLTVQDFFADLGGFGGQGADGGAAAAEGIGGDGTGGTAMVRLGGEVNGLTSFTIQATGSGGAAGDAGFGSDAARGGNGIGGSVDVEISGTGALLTGAPDMFLYGTATGGSGGAGGAGGGTIDGGTGGTGGDATGGSVRFAISGVGASADLGGAATFFDAAGFAGTGGRGGDNLTGGNAGTGGTGGNGVGGAITIEARSGTALTLADDADISSSGLGGQGGTGGGIDMAAGGFAGTGGAGGVGTGGSPTLRAIGGTILGGDVQLTAAGLGGAGGIGGDDGLSVLGMDGAGGAGIGGTSLIEVLEGSPGIITLDNVDLLANGAGGLGATAGATTGGLAIIRDVSTDPLGLITLGSLNVDTSGQAAIAGGGFLMSGGSGAITVTNNLAVNSAGDIIYNFDGDGQLVVGGNSQLITDGNIRVTHSNNTAPILSLDLAGNFYAIAGGDFTAGVGTIISSNELLIDASGNVLADDLRAMPGIVITAGGSVTLNDAVATGPQGVSNFRGIIVDAGFNSAFGIPLYDPAATATITGTVQSYADITIRSGGSAVFASGADVTADNALLVRSGDDIIVATGAALTSANNPTDAVDAANPFGIGPNIALLAGDITNLISTPFSPLASVVIDGTINANSGAVTLTGNAVDALDAVITGSSLQADINDAPANGVLPGDDNALLSAACLQGTVCLGNISADNRIEIGQNSNNDVINLIIEQGTVNAQDILITTRSAIVMGTTGIATTLAASNQFTATSTEGDVNLLDADISSDSIRISAAGSLLGTASLTSTGDIAIDVGQDLNAALIDTGGALTNIIPGFRFIVPGAVNIGSLSQGNSTVRINAGTDLSIGAIAIDGPGNSDILLTASDIGTGDVFLGTASGVRNIVLNGDNIGFGDLTANGVITLETPGIVSGGDLTSASTMSIEGTSVDVGDISTDFITTINAIAGNIQTGAITSTSTVRITGTGDVSTGDIAADLGLSVAADGAIDAGTITTMGAVADIGLAAGGTLDFVSIDGSRLVNLDGTAINGGDILGAAQINVDGTSVSVGDVTSTGGFVLMNSTTGNLNAGVVVSGNLGVQLNSAADLVVGNLAGRGITVAAIGNALVGDAASGNSLTFNIGGDLTAGLLDAQAFSPGMGINVGGDADIAGASTNGLLTVTVDGALTGGDFTGASLTRLTAGSLDIASAGSVDQALTVIATIGDAIIGSASSTFGTTVTAAGDVGVGNANSGTFTTLRGDNVALDTGSVGGNLTLDATAGDVTGTGAVTVGGAINLDATGAIAVGALDAQGGNFTADAGGPIGFTAASASGNVVINTAGAITGGDINAGGAAILDGGDIAIGNVSATNIDLTSATNILFDSLTSPNAITLSALSGIIGANIGNGDIDSDDDVTLTAQSIAIGNVTSGGTVQADATAGPATFGGITSAGSTRLSATGALTSGDIAVGNLGAAIGLSASDIIAGGLTTNGGDILLSAAQNITIGSAATSASTPNAGSIGLLAGGDITATGLLSAGEDVAILSLGDTALADVQAGDDLTVQADGAITLGAVTTTGTGIDLFSLAFAAANAGQAGAIAFAAETADLGGSNIQLTGGADLTATGTLNAADNIAIRVTGTPSLVNAISGGDTSITGAFVTLNTGNIGGDLTLNATAGDIDGTGAVTVGGAIDFDAAGAVGFGDLAALGGDFTVNAGSDVTFTGAASSADIVITTMGAINGGDVSAGGTARLDGGDIAIGAVNASTIEIISDTDILFDSQTSPNAITLSALSGIIGANIGNGDIDSGADITLTAEAISVGDLTSGGAIGANASAGDASFGAVDAATDITIIAAGTPSFTSVTSGANTAITGSSIVFGGGDIGGSLSLTSTIGDLSGVGVANAGGDISLTSAGTISFDDITVPNGGFVALAEGDITLGNVTVSDDIVIGSSGNGDIGVSGLTAGEAIQITTGGAFSAGRITGDLAASDVTIRAADGIAIGVLTGASADLQSVAGSVVVRDDIDMGGLVRAFGTIVSLTSLGDLAVNAGASNGNVTISADGDLDLQGVSANGDITITSGGSALVSGAPIITQTPQTIGQSSGQSLGQSLGQSVGAGTQQITSANGNISFAIGGDLIIGSTVSAANNLDMNVVGLIDLQDTASGAAITLRSSDINIGSGGALGRSDQTQSITIAADADIVLGGDGAGVSGFVLDNDEFSRVHSGGDIAISADGFSTGDGNLTIDDLAVAVGAGSGPGSGSGTPTDGNIGQGGALFLAANNNVEITGAAIVSGADGDTRLAIDAVQNILIDAANGGLRVEDSAGAIAGRVELSGLSVIAASPSALADIASGTVAQTDIRLGQNDEPTRDTGYLQAGSVTFTVDEALLIQNSGAGTELDDRRGVTANNVTIDSANPDVTIVFNGIVGGAAGIDAIAVTAVPGAFNQASTINGCLIANPASCVPVIIDPVGPGTAIPFTDPIQDLIEDQIEEEEQVGGGTNTTPVLVDYRKDPEQSPDPLIDEPVTGAGNEDLWVSDEAGDDCDNPDGVCPATGALEPAE